MSSSHSFCQRIINRKKNNVMVVGIFLQVSKGSILEPRIVWTGEIADEILTEGQNSYEWIWRKKIR